MVTRDFLCARRDSNPHDVSHQILSLARLPITPRAPLRRCKDKPFFSILQFLRLKMPPVHRSYSAIFCEDGPGEERRETAVSAPDSCRLSLARGQATPGAHCWKWRL